MLGSSTAGAPRTAISHYRSLSAVCRLLGGNNAGSPHSYMADFVR